jgi:hypothetical protein
LSTYLSTNVLVCFLVDLAIRRLELRRFDHCRIFLFDVFLLVVCVAFAFSIGWFVELVNQLRNLSCFVWLTARNPQPMDLRGHFCLAASATFVTKVTSSHRVCLLRQTKEPGGNPHTFAPGLDE